MNCLRNRSTISENLTSHIILRCSGGLCLSFWICSPNQVRLAGKFSSGFKTCPLSTSKLILHFLTLSLTYCRVFRIVISRLDELFLRSSQTEVGKEPTAISPDDYRECNYLLRTASNILSSLSHSGWITLLTHTLSQPDKHQDLPASEGECFS